MTIERFWLHVKQYIHAAGYLLKDYSPIYISSLNIFRPWEEWITSRKIFNRPKMKFMLYPASHETNIYIRTCKWRVFGFKPYSCIYDYEWEDLVFMYGPCYVIDFWFGKPMRLKIKLTPPDNIDDDIYWDALLYYNHESEKITNKDKVIDLVDNCKYKTYKNGQTEPIIETAEQCLTDYAKELYKQGYAYWNLL